MGKAKEQHLSTSGKWPDGTANGSTFVGGWIGHNVPRTKIDGRSTKARLKLCS